MPLAPLIILLTAAEPVAPTDVKQQEAEVLGRIRHSLAGLKKVEVAPSPPPLVPAPDEPAPEPEPEEVPEPAEERQPPEEIPDVLAPTPARTEVETDDLRDESERRGGPPSRVGVVAVAGAEGAFATNDSGGFWLRPRAGVGLRIALTAPETNPEVTAGTPAIALVGGYAGALDHRIFGELRAELVVNRGGGSLFIPGFTAYALGGFDALLEGGIDPYVGLGIGWDHNVFKGGGKARSHGGGVGGGWGSGWGGGLGSVGGGGGNGLAVLAVLAGAAVAVAVAVGLVIGFVCAGRVELRYHPASLRRAPPTVSVLLGYGI